MSYYGEITKNEGKYVPVSILDPRIEVEVENEEFLNLLKETQKDRVFKSCFPQRKPFFEDSGVYCDYALKKGLKSLFKVDEFGCKALKLGFTHGFAEFKSVWYPNPNPNPESKPNKEGIVWKSTSFWYLNEKQYDSSSAIIFGDKEEIMEKIDSIKTFEIEKTLEEISKRENGEENSIDERFTMFYLHDDEKDFGKWLRRHGGEPKWLKSDDDEALKDLDDLKSSMLYLPESEQGEWQKAIADLEYEVYGEVDSGCDSDGEIIHGTEYYVELAFKIALEARMTSHNKYFEENIAKIEDKLSKGVISKEQAIKFAKTELDLRNKLQHTVAERIWQGFGVVKGVKTPSQTHSKKEASRSPEEWKKILAEIDVRIKAWEKSQNKKQAEKKPVVMGQTPKHQKVSRKYSNDELQELIRVKRTSHWF